jgi:hypothetical protein
VSRRRLFVVGELGKTERGHGVLAVYIFCLSYPTCLVPSAGLPRRRAVLKRAGDKRFDFDVGTTRRLAHSNLRLACQDILLRRMRLVIGTNEKSRPFRWASPSIGSFLAPHV